MVLHDGPNDQLFHVDSLGGHNRLPDRATIYTLPQQQAYTTQQQQQQQQQQQPCCAGPCNSCFQGASHLNLASAAAARCNNF